MATVPSQSTVAVADRITAALWNDDVRDAIQFLLGQGSNPFPFCQVYQSGNISTADTTFTLVTFDSESWDTDTMHSTSSNTSRVVFTTAGIYRVDAYASFAANGTGRRRMQLRLNAAGSFAGGTALHTHMIAATSSGVAATLAFPLTRRFSAGDYVELFVEQTSGGALNATGSASDPAALGVTAQWIAA